MEGRVSATPYYRVDAEHSGELGREVWVLGPPGTGKTTFLSGSVRNTALLRGNRNVAVASFTTTAAAEIAGRGLGLPKSQVGTLHSLAYRAIDCPPVADEQVDDWNTHHPAWALTRTGRSQSLDDSGAVEAGANGASEGDALASRLDALRAARVPVEHWPSDVGWFGKAWDAWKRANGVIDFSDMIEMALDGVEYAPGRPDVLFADEVQDFTPLELALVRKWGRHAERLILAGDDDQSVYSFRGAHPDAWLDQPIPDADKIVLSQSWRIPHSVHRAAEHWIRQVGRREDKLYLPRAEEGLVRRIGVDFQQPHMLADQIEASLATTDVDNDGVERPATVMVLATCGYMLDPVKHELRKRGLPFANPWRRSRGDWNPFPASTGRTVSSRERLLAYLTLDERDDVGLGDLARPWTGQDVKRWAHVVKKRGIFIRGAAAAIEALPDRELEFDEIAGLFVDDVELEQAVTPDLGWLERNLTSASRAPMTFPIEVARRRGARALLDEPRVFLGTMHSFKGAQASVVYLIPDLSTRGSNEWRQRGAPQDSVRRLFYVGMTRARRELAVCAAATSLHVSPEQIVAGARRQAA
jgi:superfamily I DNA/RNA helicase